MRLTQADRDKMDPEDFAGPDKSFPIKDQDHLRVAVRDLGRYKGGDKAAIKQKIIAIAKRKNLDLPDTWNADDDDADDDDTMKNADVDGRPSAQDFAERLRRAVDNQLPGAFMVEHGTRALIAQHGYGADAKHMRHPFTRSGDTIKIGKGAPVRQSWVESETPGEQTADPGSLDETQPAALSDAGRAARYFATDQVAQDDETLAFATDLRGLQMSDSQATAIEVCRDGAFPGHPKGGDIVVDAAFRAALVKNFDAKVRKVDLALDYAHDTRGPAAGWFRRLYNDGTRTMAEIDFTPSARMKVQSGEYRYFSPEWHPNWKDPQTGKEHGPTLFGGGICNRPFLRGMAAIQCAEGGNDEPVAQTLPTDKETKIMAEKTDGAANDAVQLTEASERVTKLEQIVAEQQAQIATMRAGEERRKLADEVEGLQFADGTVAIAPATRTTLVEALLPLGAEQRAAVLAAVRGMQVVQLGELGHAGNAKVGDDGLTEFETDLVKNMAKDNGLTFDEVKAQFIEVKKSRGID